MLEGFEPMCFQNRSDPPCTSKLFLTVYAIAAHPPPDLTLLMLFSDSKRR